MHDELQRMLARDVFLDADDLMHLKALACCPLRSSSNLTPTFCRCPCSNAQRRLPPHELPRASWQELREHVINSDVVIALQTPQYLLRPWCIYELLTAIEHTKPIIALKIEGRNAVYDFEVPAALASAGCHV